MTTLFATWRDRSSWMRERREGEPDKVAFPELFFDLVFVLSIVQLSHTFASHYSLLGAIEVMVMILAIWRVWIFTTWVTNWLDPSMLLLVTLLVLVVVSVWEYVSLKHGARPPLDADGGTDPRTPSLKG